MTGAAGDIGSQVVPLLLNDPEISHVCGIDIAPFQALPHPRFTPIREDIRDPEVHKHFQETDCLMHLAFVVKNIHDDAKTRETNLAGTENLLRACEVHSVKKIVFASSAAVYGSRPENPVRMREETPVRPDPHHVYSVCKVAVENRLQQFREANPDVILCILRPTLVVGPGFKNTYVSLLRKRYLFSVRGYDPMMQAISVREMAHVLYLTVKKDISGVFNIGPTDAVPLSEVCRLLRVRRIPLPKALFSACIRFLYRCRLSSIPPESLTRFLYPVTVDSSLFQNSFDWSPVPTTMRSLEQIRRGSPDPSRSMANGVLDA